MAIPLPVWLLITLEAIFHIALGVACIVLSANYFVEKHETMCSRDVYVWLITYGSVILFSTLCSLCFCITMFTHPFLLGWSIYGLILITDSTTTCSLSTLVTLTYVASIAYLAYGVISTTITIMYYNELDVNLLGASPRWSSNV
jgi:predicted benzoate:H+ symporter BenE